ncbi:MAG: hypothetical protein AB1629_08220 [Candidatus Omnitrophota bacterium]
MDPTGNFFWFVVGALVAVGIAAGVSEDFRDFLKDEVMKPAISFVTGFVFSGFNPIVGLSAAITTSALDTGKGRQFLYRFTKEFFDDVLGFKPKAAYILSTIVAHTVATLALETTIANTLYPKADIVPFDKNNPQDMAMLKDPKGYDSFGRMPVEEGRPDAFDYSKLRTLAIGEDRVGILGTDIKQGGLTKLGITVQHSGGIVKNFPGQGIENISVLGLKGNAIYATLFGTCHQATNQTFLMGGLANTVWNQGWEFKATTIIYGNYGGGLVEKINWGVQAAHDYKN